MAEFLNPEDRTQPSGDPPSQDQPRKPTLELGAGSRKPSPPPNYLARKEQYRLLILCAMLMLVLVMMNEVRKPEMWDWMWAGDTKQDIADTTQDQEPIDTRIENRRTSKVPANAFRVAKREQNQAATAPTRNAMLPGITPELLSPIEDNSILRVAENDAWQTILAVLKETQQASLLASSIDNVSFAQLFRQTESYRGRVVSVRGTIRRTERIPTRENENGIDELFRWIVEPAGPSNAPIVIYSLEKPTGFEITDDLREDATFTGVLFKRWAYAAGDGTRIAPLLLAKTATWQPKPPPKPVELPATPIVAATLTGLVLLATGVATFVYRNSKAKHPDVERARQYMSRGVDQLDESEVLPSVAESLQQLAAEATSPGEER